MAAKKLRITFHDGKETVVQPTLEDRLRFESTLRKNRGWGELKDNALKLEPFLAWSAATRAGETSLSWEEFTSGPTAALDVQADTDPAPAEPADDELGPLEVEGVGKVRSGDAPLPLSPPSARLRRHPLGVAR